MPTQLQIRGGTTTQHASFTGLSREITIDTDKNTVVVHDGATAGGHELALADLSNVTLPPSTNTTYEISAETATGGANLRLTGSDASADNVKLAAGSNVTITRTDASTITIASSGGGTASNSFTTIAVAGQSNVVADSSADTLTLVAGAGISLTTNATTDTITITNTGGGSGGGSGTVNAGTANALAFYPAAGDLVDDIAEITWDSGTTTLNVAGTLSADSIISTGAGTPNFSSDTDLQIVTDANGTPKTFSFNLDGTISISEDTNINMQGSGANAIQALGSLEIGCGGALNLVSVASDITIGPGANQSVIVDGSLEVNEKIVAAVNAQTGGTSGTPVALDVTKTIQHLTYNSTNRYFTLANGVEGQVMHFILDTTDTSNVNQCIITVANLRYIDTATSDPHIGTTVDWNPIKASTDSAGTTPTMVTAIFVGGAWAVSGGLVTP